MDFDPTHAALLCPYCGHENPIPQSEDDVEELDFAAFLETALDDEQYEERQTVRCPGCTAETTFAPDITSDECPFCGTPIVLTATTSKQIRPRSVLPFHITSRAANESFRTWLGRLWFAPNALRKLARTDRGLAGVYTPYWTYDSSATSWYTGQRGDHYYTTQTYTTMVNGKSVTRTRQVQHTRWSGASGVVWNGFDDVLVIASRTLPHGLTRKLEPWDLHSLEPYSDAFLSGFRAESYQIGLEEGFRRAEEIMDPVIRATVCGDIGGDVQRISTLRTQHDNLTFKHLLLPIWVGAYRYRRKTFRFLVNARTGEVQGTRPYSWMKITLLVLLILAIIVGIILFAKSH